MTHYREVIMTNKELLIKNILFLRTSKGWSQVELAKKLNVTPKTILTWEKGYSLPRKTAIEKICNLFNIEREELENKDLSTIYENQFVQVNHIDSTKDINKSNNTQQNLLMIDYELSTMIHQYLNPENGQRHKELLHNILNNLKDLTDSDLQLANQIIERLSQYSKTRNIDMNK